MRVEKFFKKFSSNGLLWTTIERIISSIFRIQAHLTVIFFGLEPQTVHPDLFGDAVKQEKSRHLSDAMDRINRQYGRGTLRHLSEGLTQPWKMNRSLQTPRYTTNWDELPVVK